MDDATEPGEHGELGALARIRAWLGKKEPQHAAYMAPLRMRFGRQRNFIERLG
ncbi:MAG TPA: hypothetical protein VG274_01235 [Rhizomicrobium sp.]|nr:hypothetical protein [Rhizomicrobium sp.]